MLPEIRQLWQNGVFLACRSDVVRPVSPTPVSDEVVAESLRLARANQAPGQTKEQTQLIAQGIQKGIAEYKRSLKARQRAADKARKQQKRQQARLQDETALAADEITPDDLPLDAGPVSRLPWWLLGASWLLFVAIAFTQWHLLTACHI